MNKKHVAVVMGGMSSEHEVSLKSGAMVVGSLDQSRFDVTPVIITQEGQWRFPGEAHRDLCSAVSELVSLGVDCVFPVLHGPFGEDGRLQGMLDLIGLSYVGSGCAASAIAIDKIRSKALVEHAGMRVAKQVVLDDEAWRADPVRGLLQVQGSVGFPCVAKSPCQGSSLGMLIAGDEQELRAGLPGVLGVEGVAMIEEFLPGPEVTCAVLDVDRGKRPRALPVTEIRPVSSPYFDYYAKYTPGACNEITPAEIPEDAARQVQEIAVHVHEVIGCRHLSRSDMILVDDEPVWLEVNTIPGMTETSLYPQAAAAAGIDFPALLGMFVEAAMADGRK